MPNLDTAHARVKEFAWEPDYFARQPLRETKYKIPRRSKDPFRLIKEHILLSFASALETVDHAMTALITKDVIKEIVELGFRASFEQNPDRMQALKDTRGLVITHDIGEEDPPDSPFTQREFCELLTKIRDENS